ncbi:hypothetical protein BDN70DRAFT_115808 [Pholiota conissans]|uniref:Uncharacterized protein n=1 Tax=Pholiota conissans TaxID=109636 RepID=A0A9P5Z0A1_9AGAR|nr:hypothetical protein BDN70DRAFT_115808 [Pholiota conissans]
MGRSEVPNVSRPSASLRSQRFGWFLHLFACRTRRARHVRVSMHQMLGSVPPTRCYVCKSPSSTLFRSSVPSLVVPYLSICKHKSYPQHQRLLLRSTKTAFIVQTITQIIGPLGIEIGYLERTVHMDVPIHGVRTGEGVLTHSVLV